MKHILKKVSDTQVEVTVTVSAEDLTEARTTSLKYLSRQVKVAGFRKGKVPANVAEKHLDPNVLANDAMQRAVDATLNEVITVESLRVLDQPKINITKFVPFTDLEYTAVIEIVPAVKLGNYQKLKAKKVVEKVAQADIDEVIQRVKQNFADKKEVKRAAEMGDETVIDFVGKKDGVAFDGGKAEDYALTLGSKTFIPGFEEAIVGHKADDTFDVPLTFPKDYQAENLRGADVIFEVTLKKITEVTLPELTDELAKKVGPFETVKELTDDITRELAAQNERQADNVYQDALVEELIQGSHVPVPEILVTDQLRSIEQDARQNLMYRGMTADEYMQQKGYKDEDEWREKEFKDVATKRVQAGLVLAELSKAEKIQVTKEELDARHAEMLAQYPNMKEQLEKPEARGDLVNRLVTEKTLERLVALNA